MFVTDGNIIVSNRLQLVHLLQHDAGLQHHDMVHLLLLSPYCPYLICRFHLKLSAVLIVNAKLIFDCNILPRSNPAPNQVKKEHRRVGQPGALTINPELEGELPSC